jgi:hypothetical protein
LLEDVVITIAGGCVIVRGIVNKQLLRSLIVTVCEPNVKPLNVGLGPKGPPLIEYVYEPAPPEADTVTEPLLPPKQLTFVCAVIKPLSTDG